MGETMPDKIPDQATGKATDPDKANVLLPPPLIFLAALAVGLLLQHFIPLPGLPGAWTNWIGFPLGAAAGALAICSALTLRAARTAINPYQPTTTIVQTGPYRFSRNPLYLALLLLCMGIAAWGDALWILLALIPAVVVLQVGVIRREEAYLAGKFGAEYRAYRARVRRWI
jgi:protein-S-isoprenylcysteine O-methyltransferase Ste14